MAEESPAGAEAILRNYCAVAQNQADASRASTMDVEFRGALPKLSKTARLRALLHISRLGRVTYQVVGSEGDGLSRLVRQNCTFLARIPIESSVESLNAGVAAGIALYEIARNR